MQQGRYAARVVRNRLRSRETPPFRYHDKGNLVQTIDSDLPTHARLTDDRWNGGVQIGYNWQSRCSLFGIEADWSWTNARASDTFLDGDGGT